MKPLRASERMFKRKDQVADQDIIILPDNGMNF